MYLYVVRLDCLDQEDEVFEEEFTVTAEDEHRAIEEAKCKARKKGYKLKWTWDARTPSVRKI